MYARRTMRWRFPLLGLLSFVMSAAALLAVLLDAPVWLAGAAFGMVVTSNTVDIAADRRVIRDAQRLRSRPEDLGDTEHRGEGTT